MRLLGPIIATILLVLLAASPASAATKRQRIERSPDLWATVNVCDTPARANVIGVRASMPGSGRRARLSMRFTVQYFDKAEREWRKFDEGGDSGWVRLGVRKRRPMESGYSFEFMPPAGGATLRGLVRFRWTAKKRKTLRMREVTEAGHRSTVGADPPNFSAATCELR